jgi:ribonuclease HI
MPYYAVKRGRTPGVYRTWFRCSSQIDGFEGAKYKTFTKFKDAKDFCKGSLHSKPVTKIARARPMWKPAAVTKSKLVINYDEPCIAYTSGACTDNDEDGSCAGAGVYWFGERGIDSISEPLPGEVQTVERAGLLAILRALEVYEEYRVELGVKLEIRTDSQYAIDCFNKWFDHWESNNWKTSSGQKVRNQDLIIAIDQARNRVAGCVIWTYVKGGNGDPCNEHANTLARIGSRELKNSK